MKSIKILITLSIAFSLLGLACVKPPKPIKGAASAAGSSSSVIILPKPKKVDISWLYPKPNVEVYESGGKVTIKISINTKEPIDVSQIEILLNGFDAKNKTDEVNILKKEEIKGQEITTTMALKTGDNAVKFVYTDKKGVKTLIEKTINKASNGAIKVKDEEGSSKIIWISPDPIKYSSSPFSTKNKELSINLRINSPDVLIKGDIKIVLNGVNLDPSSDSELAGNPGGYSFSDIVMLNDKKTINDIGIKVIGRSGNMESAKMHIEFTPVKPNLYILSIGPKTTLTYTIKDAQDFARIYKNQGKTASTLFNTVTVDSLFGKKATASEIRKSIAKIKTKISTGNITEDDIVMVFISSHGNIIDGDLWIQGDDYDSSDKKETSVSYQTNILKPLNELPCKKVVFIDACHSGIAKSVSASELNAALRKIKDAKGIAVITSSRENEESHEHRNWQNGAFTKAICVGLKDGKADANSNGLITLNELYAYISKEVPNMVFPLTNKDQNPQITRNELGGDFPIFVVK